MSLLIVFLIHKMLKIRRDFGDDVVWHTGTFFSCLDFLGLRYKCKRNHEHLLDVSQATSLWCIFYFVMTTVSSGKQTRTLQPSRNLFTWVALPHNASDSLLPRGSLEGMGVRIHPGDEEAERGRKAGHCPPTLPRDHLFTPDVEGSHASFLETEAEGSDHFSFLPFWEHTSLFKTKILLNPFYSFLPSGAKADIPLRNRMPNLLLFLL